MRIWHEKLIPKLCQKHLCAMWREGLGCFKILIEDKKGYRNHPAVKEFDGHIDMLWIRLFDIREEMKKRGYNPKELPLLKHIQQGEHCCEGLPIPWQTLEQQIEILKAKGCKCNI